MGEPKDTPVGTIRPGHFAPRDGDVRHRIFLGPKFLYALFYPDDRLHEVSRALPEYMRDGDLSYRHPVVNEHAIDEAATRLKKRASMKHVESFFAALQESDLFRVEYVPEPVFDDARDQFVAWDDQSGSFTDFAIAAHAEELDIDHLATYDSDFGAFDLTTVPYLE